MRINTKKIQKEIDRREWTVKEFAEKCGLTRQAMEYIMEERSTKLPTIDIMAKILDISDPKDLLI